jgi:hypothetical protein
MSRSSPAEYQKCNYEYQGMARKNSTRIGQHTRYRDECEASLAHVIYVTAGVFTRL